MTNEEVAAKRTEAVEGVLREQASRRGLRLRKSPDDGTYDLMQENDIRVGGEPTTGHGLTLKAVAAELGLNVISGEDGPSLTTWARR